MRNQIIDNLRGLCLLGVIAIHVGSIALSCNSFWFYTLLEVLSRYSVPAFFFVSGFGLFGKDSYLLALAQNKIAVDSFSYQEFLPKRLKSAGLPYLSWSIFYQLYFWLTLGYLALAPAEQLFLLGFGLSCYHLYFMVILLVFYLTQPLWRKLMACILRTSIPLCMGLIFILQLVIFYFSSHNQLNPDSWPTLWKNLYVFRLNYVPFYYFFIYLMGGLMALYWDKAKKLLQNYFYAALAFYLASIIYIEGSAYYSFTQEHYDLLSLAFTYHQLSPQGLIYTIGSIGGFCALLLRYENSANIITKTINILAKYSMLMYFIHPLFLDLMIKYYTRHGIVITVKKGMLTYVLLVLSSLLASMLLQKLFSRSKLLRLLFTGK